MHLGKIKKIQKHSKILKNFMKEIYQNQYTINDEKVEGWKFLPRICIKVYTQDTYFYSILNEHVGTRGQDHLTPWYNMLYETFRISLLTDDLNINQSQYVFRASFMSNSDINTLLKIISDHSDEQILIRGFVNASMNCKIALNYI